MLPLWANVVFWRQEKPSLPVHDDLQIEEGDFNVNRESRAESRPTLRCRLWGVYLTRWRNVYSVEMWVEYTHSHIFSLPAAVSVTDNIVSSSGLKRFGVTSGTSDLSTVKTLNGTRIALSNCQSRRKFNIWPSDWKHLNEAFSIEIKIARLF